MRERTAAEEAKFGHLRAAYEDAFREFALQVTIWQSFALEGTEKAAVESAQHRADEALAAYRQARNLLVEFILASKEFHVAPAKANAKAAAAAASEGGSPTCILGDNRSTLKAQVEATAHQLWERAGRPVGNAEADWYRAEQLVLRR